MFKDQLYYSYLVNVTEVPPQTLIIMICKCIVLPRNKTTKTQQTLQASNQELVLCNFWRNMGLVFGHVPCLRQQTVYVLRGTTLEPQLRQQISTSVQLASRRLAEAQHSCRICHLGNESLCPPKCTEEQIETRTKGVTWKCRDHNPSPRQAHSGAAWEWGHQQPKAAPRSSQCSMVLCQFPLSHSHSQVINKIPFPSSI